MHANTASLHPDVLAVLDGLDVSDRPINHPAGARVLPKEAYMSPAFHEFEREAVFMRSWLCVGREQQLPNVGDYLAVTLLDEPLLIVRGKDRKIRAMSALCRHRGHVLQEQCSGKRDGPSLSSIEKSYDEGGASAVPGGFRQNGARQWRRSAAGEATFRNQYRRRRASNRERFLACGMLRASLRGLPHQLGVLVAVGAA